MVGTYFIVVPDKKSHEVELKRDMDKTEKEKKIKMDREISFLADLIHTNKKHAKHRPKLRQCVETKKNLNLKSEKQLPT